MEGNEVIGIIPAFDPELSLKNLRREIEDDFELKNFDFQAIETDRKIGVQEEEVIKVDSLLQSTSSNEVLVINITKHSSTSCPTSESSSTTHASTSESAPLSPGPSTLSTSTRLSVTNFLRSPTSWQIRGVKIYTTEEIERTKGLEKNRCLFWNTEAKKLCKETKKSKGNIAKAIDLAWRQHQSSLLLEEEALVSKMESTSSTTAEFLGKRKCKPGYPKKKTLTGFTNTLLHLKT